MPKTDPIELPEEEEPYGIGVPAMSWGLASDVTEPIVLTPDESKAIQGVAMLDAVENPESEVLPQATKTTTETLASLYQEAEDHLNTLYPQSFAVPGPGRGQALVWHDGQVCIKTDALNQRSWRSCPEGVQAEFTPMLNELRSRVSDHCLKASAKVAASAAKA